MADWAKMFEPMEQKIEELLAATPLPESVPEVEEPLLSGALPLLDEVLAPAAQALASADEHALAADLHIQDAIAALSAWRERTTALLEHLASSAPRAVS